MPIEPTRVTIRKIANMIPTSPTTFMTNALRAACDRARAVEPEADQEVRREPDQPPADEQADDVVAEHQRQHREDEEVHVGEEAREGAVAVHVADRVDVDQEADAGDDQRPHECEPVELQPERPAGEPRHQRQMRAPPAAVASFHSVQRRDERDADQRGADRAGPRAQLRAERPEQHGADQRQEPNEIEQHRCGQPLSAATSSTSTCAVRRNVTATIASAMAASAAATVMTRKAKTCPALFAQARA